MAKLFKRFLRHISTLVIITAVSTALCFMIVSQVTGWQISPVYGSGMSPTFDPGDALIIESVKPEAIKLNDIMSYNSPLDGQLTTHRVVESLDLQDGLYFRTRGDNLEEADPYIVPSENITGRVKYQIDGLGYFSYFSRTPLGIILMMGVPGLIITTTEINALIGTLIPQEKRRRVARWTTGMKKKDWIR